MFDKIEKLECGSIIQHGPYNDRIYLLKVSERKIYSLPSRLIAIAEKNGYGKIFAKVDETQARSFLNNQFIVEAKISEMYPKEREGLFLAFYLKKNRKIEPDFQLYVDNLLLALDKKSSKTHWLNKIHFNLRQCTKDDIPVMIEIYKKIFPTYPFPIHDPEYLIKTMKNDVDYFCVESKGKLVALSSAEKDNSTTSAEMTDFATLPDWRGNGLAIHLLKKMEKSIKKQGFSTAFTIARSASAGMNITFSKSGYTYGGRLINNTNISGKIESMNVWHKKL